MRNLPSCSIVPRTRVYLLALRCPITCLCLCSATRTSTSVPSLGAHGVPLVHLTQGSSAFFARVVVVAKIPRTVPRMWAPSRSFASIVRTVIVDLYSLCVVSSRRELWFVLTHIHGANNIFDVSLCSFDTYVSRTALLWCLSDDAVGFALRQNVFPHRSI